MRPLLGWLLEVPGASQGISVAAAGLLPAMAALAALSAWQAGDAVYRATATEVLGPQALSVFWYPVTLGALGLLAVRGWQRWIAAGDARLLGVGAWTVAVIVLHTSTVLNGYHFVYQLWPPLCIAAAPTLARALEGASPARAAVLLVLLFQASFTLTAKCIDEVQTHRIRAAGFQVLDALAKLPPGNVLAPADLGNYIPAYTDHRVYVGHWFLTPAYAQRAQEAAAALGGRMTAEQLMALVDSQHVRYLVAPAQVTPALAAGLGRRAQRSLAAGEYAILVVD